MPSLALPLTAVRLENCAPLWYPICCVAILLSMVALAGTARGEPRRDSAPESSLLEVNHRSLVSHSDLIYQSPAGRPVEGQPIGDGRMGALVWTIPSGVCFQINRSDVFAVNKEHAGTFLGPTDYFGACAQIAIGVGGQPFLAGKAFTQRLSLYEAEATISGEALSVRCFVSATTDVLALEINDQCPDPQPVRVAVSMWRAPDVVNGSHVARYEFAETTDSGLVVQRFDEKSYHCASAVAAHVAGDGTQVEVPGERARTVVAPPKKGKRTLLISSAASWAPGASCEAPTALL